MDGSGDFYDFDSSCCERLDSLFDSFSFRSSMTLLQIFGSATIDLQQLIMQILDSISFRSPISFLLDLRQPLVQILDSFTLDLRQLFIQILDSFSSRTSISSIAHIQIFDSFSFRSSIALLQIIDSLFVTFLIAFFLYL